MEMSHGKVDHLTSVQDSIADSTCSIINNSLEGRHYQAAVRLVNGEHRISFWSTANLSAGTERFFNMVKISPIFFNKGRKATNLKRRSWRMQNLRKGSLKAPVRVVML